METGNLPRIAILMAVYEPRLDWLRQQLRSLDSQDYPNIRLYIRDDCSPTVPHEAIKACVEECIHAFPWELRRNERNLGSNKTFERLTAEAEGTYFAYCDQDDVWLPEKLSVLQAALEREEAQLVCSDMYVIDGRGKRIAESILKVNRRQRFYSGEHLKTVLLRSNFVTGTAMLIRAETAKAAIPFSPYTVHDWYLALCAAREGKILSLPDRLLHYRIHGGNQTLPMAGIHDRKSYREERIVRRLAELRWLRERFSEDPELRELLDRQCAWVEARDRWFRGSRGAARQVWAGRENGPVTALFELIFARAPEPVLMFFVHLRRRNVL